MDAGGFRGTRLLITDICTSTEPRPGRGGSILARREMTGTIDHPFKKRPKGIAFFVLIALLDPDCVHNFDMPKRGDIREDGLVFAGKNKNLEHGEYWTSMSVFLRQHGEDWYERRAIMDENVRLRALEKEEAKNRADALRVAKEEKIRIQALKPKRNRRVFASDEERQKAQKEYAIARRQTEVYKKHKKAWNEKQKAKTQEKRKIKIAEKEAKEEEKRKIKISREKEREAKRIEKSKILALKKPRVFLTNEQRLEAKRQEKRNYKHARRARINNCEIRATPQMVADARKNAGDRCYYCGKKSELTLDHFEPLAKGGAHCVSNFVFACFSCNSRKRDLDPFDFMASNVAASF